MPTCPRCGEQNPDNVTTCNKCGIAFGHQVRANADASRAKARSGVRIAAWVVAVVVLIVIGPRLYHSSVAAYLKYHLKSVTSNTLKDCGGPITESMADYQKTQVQSCISSNADLQKAQSDYSNFTKSDQP